MPVVRALPRLRTNLLAAGAARPLTVADAVTFDLGTRRRTVARGDWRGAHVRLASGREPSDLDAALAPSIAGGAAALLLRAVLERQDVRNADVALRRHEVRANVEPGAVRLILEVDSAWTLAELPPLLAAVDRHGGVTLNVEALAADLGLRAALDATPASLQHAVAEVALAAVAARLPWWLFAPAATSGVRARLAELAYREGASGIYVAAEPEVAGFNALFGG